MTPLYGSRSVWTIKGGQVTNFVVMYTKSLYIYCKYEIMRRLRYFV